MLSILAFAVTALASGADRLSEQNPARTRLVPPLLQAHAARVDAAAALARGNPAWAETAARSAVRASPSDARATGLLGTARLLSGDEAGARAAYRVARRGGWRDPVVQTYWLNSELAAGEASRAVTHFEAIVRAWPEFVATDALLAGLMTEDAARAALAGRVTRRSEFARALLAVDWLDTSEAVALRAELLLDPAFDEQPLGCAIVEPMIDGLSSRQMSKRAEAVQQRHCPL